MDAHDDIRFFGHTSGYQSIICYTPLVYVHGYYGAAYGDIHSVAGPEMTVYISLFYVFFCK